MKEKLLVSFSGGETSAYMTWWIWNNWRDKYDVVVVFANTGDENEETLEFVEQCSTHFGFPVVWVEANVFHGNRKGTGHRVVDFLSASRRAEPFEEVIKKYGIPNKSFPHCTRELKANPIRSYARSIGWKKYETAVGIRIDEIDRMAEKRNDYSLIYPLIKTRPMTKQKINFWWSMQPFRLRLKGYQGNCKVCHKKSDPKLYQIAKESPQNFDSFERFEEVYGDYIPKSQSAGRSKENVFYRKNRSVKDIKREAEQWDGVVKDDTQDFDNESCEVFSECGIDN